VRPGVGDYDPLPCSSGDAEFGQSEGFFARVIRSRMLHTRKVPSCHCSRSAAPGSTEPSHERERGGLGSLGRRQLEDEVGEGPKLCAAPARIPQRSPGDGSSCFFPRGRPQFWRGRWLSQPPLASPCSRRAGVDGQGHPVSSAAAGLACEAFELVKSTKPMVPPAVKLSTWGGKPWIAPPETSHICCISQPTPGSSSCPLHTPPTLPPETRFAFRPARVSFLGSKLQSTLDSGLVHATDPPTDPLANGG